MSKRSSILVALPLVLAFGILGCGGGSSSPSAPVDTVAPAAVIDLGVEVVQGLTPSIEVNWEAGAEPDLAGYRVYRGVDGGDVALVGTVTSVGYTDGTVSKGSLYRYEVGAIDRTGNESPRVGTSWVAVPNDQTGGGRGQLD
jgi:fibronectin type 3 domain-containing protein